MADDKEKKSNPDEELLKTALERFKNGLEAEQDNRDDFEEDVKFYLGENHWPEQVKTLRENDQRPCMVINRIPQFVRQVTNDQRQNRPSIKVSPVDDAADPDTAEIMQGLIRHIEYDSNADAVYDTGFFNAVCGGFGFWRVVSEYEADGFEQCLKFRQVPNSLSVVFDPHGVEPDGSDWEWCFVSEMMGKEAFKREYPSIDPDDFQGDDEHNWITEDEVRVADYYHIKDWENKTVCLLEDGRVKYKDDLEPGDKIDKTREVKVPKIEIAKITSFNVLDRTDWAGKYIPVVPVWGDVVQSEGKTYRTSLIRNAKDPQRMFNYARSAAAEATALAPKAPWVAAEGQIEGYEDEWENANNKNYSVLPYNPIDINGMAVPPPQRQMPAQISPGLEQLGVNAQQDLMGTIGIYESGLGEQGNETSGRAIMARQREGDTGTFHFADNMRRAIRHTGRILVDVIPKIYDSPRVTRILGEDGSERLQKVNETFTEKDKWGQEVEKIYDLTMGRYDVVISQGASYNSKRQEAAEHMVEIMRGNPQVMEQFGDIIFKEMDWPGADKFADRFRKMLPPELRDDMDEDGDGQPDNMPPEIAAQIKQYEGMIQELDQTIQAMGAELESKEAENLKAAKELQIKEYEAQTNRIKAEADAKAKNLGERELAQFKAETEIRLKDMELDHQESMAVLDAKVELTKANINPEIAEFDDDLNPVQSEMANNVGMLQDRVVELMEHAQSLSNELSESKQPKLLERDGEGRIVGVNGRKVIFDDDGQIAGLAGQDELEMQEGAE